MTNRERFQTELEKVFAEDMPEMEMCKFLTEQGVCDRVGKSCMMCGHMFALWLTEEAER